MASSSGQMAQSSTPVLPKRGKRSARGKRLAVHSVATGPVRPVRAAPVLRSTEVLSKNMDPLRE